MRRCYKLVRLIHTNRAAEFFLYAGLVVTASQDHECPLLHRFVEEFVGFHGRGVLKRLIVDRGFLDGAQIGRCKQDWNIDVLMPVRHKMEIYQDIVGLAQAGQLSFQLWTHPVASPNPLPVHRPEWIQKREEAPQKTLARKKAEASVPAGKTPATLRVRSAIAAVEDLETFSTFPVPLNPLVNREIFADGHEEYWVCWIRRPSMIRAGLGKNMACVQRSKNDIGN